MRYIGSAFVLGSIGSLVGCGAPTAPAATNPFAASALVVQSVVPTGGATGVDPAAPITVAFNHAMMQGMELLVVLHDGSVTGAEVAGTSAWSTDRTQLTFTPAAPLKPQTTYVLHLSPNLKDSTGATIDWPTCASRVGGTAASAGMLGGGMMGGGMSGGGMGPGMMGTGWQPGTGAWGYGMLVTFTTA